MLLEVTDLDVFYGRTHALKGLNLHVERGEIVAVLGANGAGKSSLLSAILGVVPPRSGEIRFDGVDLSGRTTPMRYHGGLVLVPEGRRIFTSLTVAENLLLGAHNRTDKSEIPTELDRICARFSNLAERRDMPASVLSGGEQQMLAIGRALMAGPDLLMLDEPSLGLSPLLVKQVFRLMQDLNREGLTILLVEQNTRLALKIADRGYVLERGAVATQGTPGELLSDTALHEAYLGQSQNAGRSGRGPARSNNESRIEPRERT